MDTKVAITISKQKMLKTERTKCCPQVLLKDFATLIEKNSSRTKCSVLYAD